MISGRFSAANPAHFKKISATKEGQPVTNFVESDVVNRYLASRGEDDFTCMFQLFVPQLIAFFRRRGHSTASAEDLTQEVMLAVHLYAGNIRNRALFRPWLFRIARNANCRTRIRLAREGAPVDLGELAERIPDMKPTAQGIAAFEFDNWLGVLDSRERDVMVLRFVEEWEYHEIAAARSIPIGTVQWRVFNSKKKLAAHLKQTLGRAAVQPAFAP
jgi:RNA polymerase sigma-70 factor (ECF subfamily)